MSHSPVISVLRHQPPEALPDDYASDTLTSVVSGNVVGELDRVSFRDDDRVSHFFGARLQGAKVAFEIRMADLDGDASEDLASLATVAAWLSGEMRRLRGGPDQYLFNA